MTGKVFVVYDSKVEAYMQPFHMPSKGAAIRAFSDAVNDESTNFYKHPEDYHLFEIGEYDDSTAMYTNLPAKVPLGCAIEFKKQLSIPGVNKLPPGGQAEVLKALEA